MKNGCADIEELGRHIVDEHWYPPYCTETPLIEYCEGIDGEGTVVFGRACNRLIVSFYDKQYKPLEYNARVLSSLIQGDIPGYTFYGDKVSIEKAVPGTPGTTSIVSLLEGGDGRYALKAYRLPTPRNIEPMVLKHLSEKGNKFVPKYVGHGEYSGYTVHLLTGWLGEKSIVPILFENARRYASSHTLQVPREAGGLGEAIASIHRDLIECVDPLCSTEPVREEDVSRWLFRIQWRLENMATHNDHVVRETVERLYSRLDEIVELSTSLNSLLKMRIHGDLHLYQVFIDGDGMIKILDFEGEPDRMPGTVLEKETRERDLACLLRSLHYVAVNAYLSRTGGEVSFETSLRALNEYSGWIHGIFNAILDTYMEGGLGISMDAIVFWSIERALYEFYYEVMWRTGLEYVPLAWLYHISELDEFSTVLLMKG